MRPTETSDNDPFIIGEKALRSAIERIRAARWSWPEVTISAGEGLWWCSSLDDWHRNRVGSDTTYWNYRDQSREGRTVAGLLYARNLTGHQLVTVPGFVEIGPPLIPFKRVWDEEFQAWGEVGLQPVEIRWRALSKLPNPTKMERYNRDEYYERYVGERALDEPLETALNFFCTHVWDIPGGL